MNVTVTGRHFEITDAIRAYARDKANKLDHFFRRTTSIDVVIAPHGRHAHDVELIAHVDGHDPFVTHCHDNDVYAAIDLSEQKLGKRLRRHKDRLTRSHRG